MRTFDDLDILVQRERIACVRELLRSNGYGLRSDGGHRQEPDPVAEPPEIRRVLSFNVRLTRDPWRKLRDRLGLVIPPSESDWLAIRSDSALAILYYPLRIVLLAMKYTFRRITGPRAAPICHNLGTCPSTNFRVRGRNNGPAAKSRC